MLTDRCADLLADLWPRRRAMLGDGEPIVGNQDCGNAFDGEQPFGQRRHLGRFGTAEVKRLVRVQGSVGSKTTHGGNVHRFAANFDVIRHHAFSL